MTAWSRRSRPASRLIAALAVLVTALVPSPSLAEETEEESAPDTTRRKPAPAIIVYERPEDDAKTREEIEKAIWAKPDDIHPQVTRIDKEGKSVSLDFVPTYNRVDELVLGATVTFEHRVKVRPKLKLHGAYVSGRDRFQYRCDFEQPVMGRDRVVLGVSLYDETAIFTDLTNRVSNAENTLAALIFREDFRHYFAHEGFEAFAGIRFTPGVSVGLSYIDERDEALRSSTNGSIGLLRRDASFRDNPAAEAGRMRSWTTGLSVETPPGPRPPALHHRHELTYESSGERAGGDFAFTRWIGELRFRLRLAPDQEVALRVKAGGLRSGRLPLQRAFYLGGIGSLRAHTFGGLVGDYVYLTNLEYAFGVYGGFQAVIFQDVGTTWTDRARLSETRPELDAGVALRNRTGRFRINFARDLRGSPTPVVTVRISQPF